MDFSPSSCPLIPSLWLLHSTYGHCLVSASFHNATIPIRVGSVGLGCASKLGVVLSDSVSLSDSCCLHASLLYPFFGVLVPRMRIRVVADIEFVFHNLGLDHVLDGNLE